MKNMLRAVVLVSTLPVVIPVMAMTGIIFGLVDPGTVYKRR